MTDETPKAKLYAWRTCSVCHANYPSDALICVQCYRRSGRAVKENENLLESEFATLVTKSGTEMPVKLFKYNLPYPMHGFKTCGDCLTANKVFCSKFGIAGLFCKREEFDACACKDCCVKYKKLNERG